MRDPAVGESFGRYRVERLLGAGGMGRVYGAYDTVLRRRVALKLLHAATADDTGPAALLREARAAAAITHPNAVAIFDVGEHEGTPYIAMELLEGRPLRAFVGDSSIGVQPKVRWLLAVARALGAAHDAGLVHRDIKPANVLVTSDDTVKVLDFGIAKRTATHDDATGEAETSTGQVKGTLRYMAPEQLSGEPLDARTDQFAWGVLAFELLSGVHPWSTISSEIELVDRIMTAEPRALREVSPEIPPALEAVVLRALAKAPEARFPDMASLASALEGVLETACEKPSDETLTVADGSANRARAQERAREGNTQSAGALAASAPESRAPKMSLERRAILVVAGMLALGGLLVGLRAATRPSPAAGASSAGPVPAAPAPTPVMALPRPTSDNPQAVAAWVSAMQAGHDAASPRAHRELERALSLDPSMAAAALRLALMEQVVDVPKAREHYHRAVAMRSLLGERDRGLLEAIEPVVDRDPSDPVEAVKRLSALALRYPRDAELQVEVAGANRDLGDMQTTIEAATRALEIDPTYASAFVARGEARAYVGDFDDAEKDFDQCLGVAPSAASCRAHRTNLRLRRLGCGGLEPDAREWMSNDPDWWLGPRLLANVELERGERASAVDEALAQAAKHEAGESQRLDESAALAVLRGDFVGAEKTSEKWLSSVEGSQADAHAAPARRLALLLDEMGKPEQAARVADDFVRRSPSWTVATQGGDYAINADFRPLALALARHAGAPSDFDKARNAWAKEWRSHVPVFFLPYIWVVGYAEVTSSREDAVAALDALASFGGRPPVYTPMSLADAFVGRTYLLAGQPGNALPYLRRAAHACALAWPVEQTRAIADLAQALAASGDTAGACSELGRVLARWGSAKPKSVTALAARERMRALGCK